MAKTKKPKDYLSQETRDVLKGSGIKIVFSRTQKKENAKYSRTKFVEIYKGYDMLENLAVVRSYIQQKYKIDSHLFEILLKLMGMRVFTRLEYSKVPKTYTYKRLQNMMDTGLINMVADNNKTELRLYSLNTKGKNIVISFYKYLSGEVPIPEDSVNNKWAKKDASTYYKKKLELIKQMNRLPIPDHKKEVFK